MIKDPTQALVENAQKGDQSAFGELFELYRPRLAALIDSRLSEKLRERVEIDDVLQETFARALQSIERFEWRGEESFIRWLGGIAENVLRRSAERQRRGREFSLGGDVAADRTSPSTALRRDERFERLQKALDDLTPEQREVIRLLRIEGLRTKEVAARLNKSTEAVKHLMLRGLRRLRRNMRESESLRLPDRALDFGERSDDRE